ncbi:MAG: TolC family protein [Spartobacteria bacterium]|nr:TolC family protein [Spartobacteria bacterium]
MHRWSYAIIFFLVPGLFPALGADYFLAFDRIPDALPESVEMSMSIEECVLKALEANYDIAIQRWAVSSAASRVLSERGAFEPDITGYAGRSETSSTNSTDGTDSGELKLNTRFVTGTKLSLYARYSAADEQSNGTGRVGIEFSQPLLRDFGIKATRAPLVLAQRNAEISRHEFALRMINTATEVEADYWQLVLARERLAVQQASLDSARELEALTLQRAVARMMSESDTIQAQAAVYEREANVVRAGENVRRIEDGIKEKLSLFADPAYWITAIIPTTKPVVLDTDVDFLAALHISLEHREDYYSELLRLRNLDLDLYTAKNQLLPKLDLTASGERQDEAADAGRTFDAASSSDQEVWSVFLRLELPLGNKEARARRDSAYAAKMQQLLRIQQLELRIIREVRRAIDALNTNRRLVAATEKAVEFEQKKLENEQIKLDLGTSSTDNVVRFIQSLNQARLSYVQAVIDYNLAQSRLAQVQGTTLNQYEMDVADEY